MYLKLYTHTLHTLNHTHTKREREREREKKKKEKGKRKGRRDEGVKFQAIGSH